jgi:L-fuculose-phosphate aldolase
MDTAAPETDIERGLDALARGYRILAMNGHTEGTLGHLSWRDPQGRGLWMKCQEIGLDEVEPHDLHLIGWDGKVLDGSNGHRHSEWVIHSETYKAREDVHAVGHTHPTYCVLFSATDEKLVGVGHNGSYFTDVKIFKETLALIRTEEDAAAMVRDLGDQWAVLLRNHGVTFVGTSIQHSVLMGIMIEKACYEQLFMKSSGYEWTGKTLTGLKDEAALYPRLITNMWNYRVRRLEKFEGRG